MRTFKIASIIATAALFGAPALAADAPTDPQIAHVAYTAGTVNIDFAPSTVTVRKAILANG
jgi:putative membrane protein